MPLLLLLHEAHGRQPWRAMQPHSHTNFTPAGQAPYPHAPPRTSSRCAGLPCRGSLGCAPCSCRTPLNHTVCMDAFSATGKTWLGSLCTAKTCDCALVPKVALKEIVQKRPIESEGKEAKHAIRGCKCKPPTLDNVLTFGLGCVWKNKKRLPHESNGGEHSRPSRSHNCGLSCVRSSCLSLRWEKHGPQRALCSGEAPGPRHVMSWTHLVAEQGVHMTHR